MQNEDMGDGERGGRREGESLGDIGVKGYEKWEPR